MKVPSTVCEGVVLPRTGVISKCEPADIGVWNLIWSFLHAIKSFLQAPNC